MTPRPTEGAPGDRYGDLVCLHLSKAAADVALMRLARTRDPERLYPQIVDADTARRRRGGRVEILYLDAAERDALRAVLPAHLRDEVTP